MRLNRCALLVAGVLSAASAAQGQGNPPVTVSVDVAANRRTISPLIYGVHFTLTADLLDLNATINRLGGNSVGRYNYLQNIDNRGGDYFFESIPYADVVGGLGDDFITATKAGGAEPYLSMPMVGSVAKTNGNRDTLYSFSVVGAEPRRRRIHSLRCPTRAMAAWRGRRTSRASAGGVSSRRCRAAVTR